MMFELFWLVCLLAGAMDNAAKTAQQTSLAPQLAREAALSLTDYLAQQRRQTRERFWCGMAWGGLALLGLIVVASALSNPR